MKLRELCSEFKYECLSGSMDVDVRDVIYDSRKITEGTVFVCMVGAVTDGHKYIPDAVKKGIEALRTGCDIVTDTQMAKAGIRVREPVSRE